MRFLIDRGPLYASFIEQPETATCREILKILKQHDSPFGDIQGIVPTRFIADMHLRLANPSIVSPPLKQSAIRKLTKELDEFGLLRIAPFGSYELSAALDAMVAERFYTADPEEAELFWVIKAQKVERIVTFDPNRFLAFPELPVQDPGAFLRDVQSYKFKAVQERRWNR